MPSIIASLKMATSHHENRGLFRRRYYFASSPNCYHLGISLTNNFLKPKIWLVINITILEL